MAHKKGVRSILPTILVIVLVLAFSGLIFGGYLVYEEKPPIPAQTMAADGSVLFTEDDVRGGQAVFLRYGIMDVGSIFGHGAYLAPDFTADYLHNMGLQVQKYYAQKNYGKSYDALRTTDKYVVDALVQEEMKANRYDSASNTLKFTTAQTAAYRYLSDYYARIFSEGKTEWGINPGLVPDTADPAQSAWHSEKELTRQLGDYFAWSAWVASANRPGYDYSYTNNWPYDELVGNSATKEVVIWSAASVGILLLVLGAILFIYVKYKFAAEESELTELPRVETFNLTPSQIKTGKFFLVVSGLFLLQALLGSLADHYFVEKEFYGLPVYDIFPFNLIRAWHLQLAIFWIATAWVAGGIFIAPLVGGKEPKYQGLLVDILFWAIVVVAVGSLVGELLGIHDLLGSNWFLLGNQGWEYIELGRIWQILLVAGLLIWLYIVFRALRYQLKREEDTTSLSHLLLYASISIPVFYGFGFFFDPNTAYSIADFWRWFIIHLWVESFFEFFATVATAYLLVNLGLVTKESATRAVYFTLILVFAAGIEGIGHHYWWIGTPAAWVAIGAVFSAVEVVPLTLLIFDAVGNINMRKRLGIEFHYRSSISFLIAAAVWNFVGAGVLGFLINPPIVSYYEHGTYLTPTHGHASMMGTYGMLAIGIMMFALRTIVRPDEWKERRIHWSFILLNLGLVLMLVMNLLPVGFLQLAAVYEKGMWYARSLEFLSDPLIINLTWARIVGDTIFLLGAAVLFWEVARVSFKLRKPGTDFKR